jgi:hypothetical protein
LDLLLNNGRQSPTSQSPANQKKSANKFEAILPPVIVANLPADHIRVIILAEKLGSRIVLDFDDNCPTDAFSINLRSATSPKSLSCYFPPKKILANR